MFKARSAREFSSNRKRKALDRLFRFLILVCRSYQNMTGTDKDDSKIDSRLPVSLSCVNTLDTFHYPANAGE
jgi:hypothetical protein